MCCSCSSLSPPMPLAMTAPQRYLSSLARSIPPSFHACMAAATARWTNGSVRPTSLGSSQSAGLKFLISPPNRTFIPSVGNFVRRAIPLRPAWRPSQNVAASLPSGVTTPSPVMTTRCLGTFVRLDVLDGVADGLDLLGGVVRDAQVEGVLDLHHELDGVETVGAEVVDEARLARDLLLRHVELAGDDGDDLLFDFRIAHPRLPPKGVW